MLPSLLPRILSRRLRTASPTFFSHFVACRSSDFQLFSFSLLSQCCVSRIEVQSALRLLFPRDKICEVIFFYEAVSYKLKVLEANVN